MTDMPKGTKVLTAETYGNSAWTITGRIQVELPTGESKVYFLKVSLQDLLLLQDERPRMTSQALPFSAYLQIADRIYGTTTPQNNWSAREPVEC